MKMEKIKPIPKYIEKKIKQLDIRKHPEQNGFTRYLRSHPLKYLYQKTGNYR